MRPNELVRNDQEFQELIRSLKRVARITAQYPIDVLKNDDAYHIYWVPPPPMLVRITGHATGGSGSGSSGQTLPENHYTGIQQLCNVGDEMSHDADSGVQFHAGFPLIEVNGVTTVPNDTVVYATPAIAGTHYEFVYGTGTRISECDQSGSGSGNACCRLQLSDIFRGSGNDDCEIADGCFQIVDENGTPVNLFLDFVPE